MDIGRIPELFSTPSPEAVTRQVSGTDQRDNVPGGGGSKIVHPAALSVFIAVDQKKVGGQTFREPKGPDWTGAREGKLRPPPSFLASRRAAEVCEHVAEAFAAHPVAGVESERVALHLEQRPVHPLEASEERWVTGEQVGSSLCQWSANLCVSSVFLSVT